MCTLELNYGKYFLKKFIGEIYHDKNKKLMMALSFTLGATLLVSTAFADIVSMSGYEQLKSAIKYTSKSCSKSLQSFTAQFTVTLKDNERVLCANTETDKFDNSIGAKESTSISEDFNGMKTTNNSYCDKKCHISHNLVEDVYHVFEYTEEQKDPQFSDLFEDDRMKDIEKIIDAGIGNLKDYVILTEKPDGNKEFSGSLDDAQIPALINAVSSFAFKNSLPKFGVGITNIFPELKDDLFIKNVRGKASVNKDGILESLLGIGTVSGKDTNGVSHDLTLEVLVRLYDINSTVVTKPDLTGKKVEKSVEYKTPTDKTLSKKYIGDYKNDIIIEKDNSFVKIGERTVLIEKIDDKHVSGRYYENYKDEYPEYSKEKRNLLSMHK